MKLTFENTKKLVRFLTTRWLLVLLLVLTVVGGSHAQVRSFKHFGLDKSTFPSRIECIAQAPGGELLIGTLTGLVIYDGYGFKTLTDQDGLAESAVSSIAVYDDHVWVGHWAGSATLLNSELSVDRILNVQRQLSYHSITAIWPLDSSRLLIATDGSGMYLTEGETTEKIVLSDAAEARNVKQLFELEKSLYAVTSSGIYRCDDKKEIGRWEEEYTSEQELNCAAFIDGFWYIGSQSGSMMASVDFKDVSPVDVATGAPLQNILSIEQDMEENIWFASARQGVMLYHPITKKVEYLKRENGLSYNRVTELLCDREGTMWVATAAGLDQYLGGAFELFDYRTGLMDNLVWDFAPISSNSLIVATSLGLQELELTSNWSGITGSKVLEAPFSGIRSVLAVADGEQWVVDDDGGLWRNLNGEFEQLNLEGNAAMSLAMFDNDIWVGTAAGIFVLSEEGIKARYTNEHGLGGIEINGLFPHPNGQELWVTSLGGGVTRYKNERFKQYDDAAGMNSKVVHDMAFDSKGNAWLATYDRGVLKYENEHFEKVSDKISINCFAIAIDDRDRIWVGHNWGIDSYDPEKKTITKFTSDEGFMGIEVNPGAITFDPSGHLWMGTIMGLLRFNPSQARHNSLEPAFRINEVSIGGTTFSPDEKISTGYGSTDLKVEYNSISLTNPALNTVRYRLLGLHDQWKEVSGNQPIEYVSLPSGDFVLEISACNAQQQCSLKSVMIPIEVIPPFYTRWWFYTLLFLMAVFAIFSVDRYRNSELTDQRIVLEDRLASRTQELDDLRLERKDIIFRQNQSEVFAASILAESRTEVDNIGRMVEQFSFASNQKRGLGSDHVVYFELGGYKVAGLIDFGVPGVIGSMAFLRWRRYIETDLLEKNVVSREGFQRVWLRSLSQIAKVLSDTGKVKEPKSGFVIFSNEGASFYNDGIGMLVIQDALKDPVIHASDNQNAYKDLMKSGELFYAVPKQSKILMFTDGLLSQINEDGTKNYSMARLTKQIQQAAKDEEPIKAENLLEDWNRWRGMMDEGDDVFILTFRYA